MAMVGTGVSCTAEEALKKMREICLSFPDTGKGAHFGETAFYVKDKFFAKLMAPMLREREQLARLLHAPQEKLFPL